MQSKHKIVNNAVFSVGITILNQRIILNSHVYYRQIGLKNIYLDNRQIGLENVT